MLGLALSEAHRSAKLGVQLQTKRSKGPQSPNSSSTSDNYPSETAASQKRPRRRRRQKKPSVRSSSGAPEESLSTRHSTVRRGPRSTKQHDAPMKKGDLYFSLRCGLVGTRAREHENAVGRVTLVNWEHETVLDAFVKVPVPVSDPRTELTGIRPEDLQSSETLSFDQVRTKICAIVKGKIVIGHGLDVDLAAMKIVHPWCDVRDTATYAPYMKEVQDPLTVMLLPRDLPGLAQDVLNQEEIGGDPVLEAIACMDLYKHARAEWEAGLMRLVQQKEKQREMVQSLRTSEAPRSFDAIKNMSLLSIKEDEAQSNNNYESIKRERMASGKSLASDGLTEPSTLPNPSLEDDCSYASSYVSNGSSLSSFSRLGGSHGFSHARIDNMHQVSNAPFHEASLGVSGFAPMDAIGGTSVSSAGSAIWQAYEEQGHGSTWSQASSSSAFAPSHDPLAEADLSTTFSNEELSGHLPSDLLDDVEEPFGNQESSPGEKSSWLFRPRRPTSKSDRPIRRPEPFPQDLSSSRDRRRTGTASVGGVQSKAVSAELQQHQLPPSPKIFSVFRRLSSSAASGAPQHDASGHDATSPQSDSIRGGGEVVLAPVGVPFPELSVDPFFLDPAAFAQYELSKESQQQQQQQSPPPSHAPPGFFGKFRRSTSTEAYSRATTSADASPFRSVDTFDHVDASAPYSTDHNLVDERASPSMFALFRRRSSTGSTMEAPDGTPWSARRAVSRA